MDSNDEIYSKTGEIPEPISDMGPASDFLPPEDLILDNNSGMDPDEKVSDAEPVEESAAEEAAGQDNIEETAADEEPEKTEEPPEEKNEIPVWLDGFEKIINDHSKRIRRIAAENKMKDDTIFKLSKELQTYREDYCIKKLTPFIMAAIKFREDRRKDIANNKKYEYSIEDVNKYIGYLINEYYEMLSGLGIEYSKDGWLYNGSPVKETEAEGPVNFVKPFEDLLIPEREYVEMPEIKTADDLTAYLALVENEITDIVRDNKITESTLKAYIEFSYNIEKDIIKVFMLPSVRILISAGDKLKKFADEKLKTLTAENCKYIYNECQEFIIEYLDYFLVSSGVCIVSELREDFDPHKDRIIKVIETDDGTKDRKICNFRSDCYLIKDKVIYQSQVDIYRYSKKQ